MIGSSSKDGGLNRIGSSYLVLSLDEEKHLSKEEGVTLGIGGVLV